jgi:energy-coupling factor transporter ATP-binding protein EcfA2
VKIKGWSVERFGALRNYEVSDLPEGLTVFCGPNGSGKSTLVAFIRQMMFAAVNGYGYGAGRLNCAGPGGRYTIARDADGRSHVSVARPEAGEAADGDIEHLFGGGDSHHIASLLTFGINDLQALPLTTPGVRERLFPAGAARGLRLIQRALDRIHVKKAEFAQRVGADLQKVSAAPVELQARIERSTHAAARLGQLLREQTEAQLTFDHRTRTISDLKTESAKYDALVELGPVWQELSQARRELESLGRVDQLPSDAEQRLEQALAARQAATRTVAQLDVQQAGRRDLPVAPEEPARLSVAVRPRVQAPEPATTGAEDTSGWQRRLKEAVEAAKDAEREFEATARNVRELEAARDEITAALKRPEPPNVVTLDEEARLVQHVRTTLSGLAKEQSLTKRWQDQIAERGTTIRELEAEVVSIPSNILCYLAWVATLCGTGAAVWRYTAGDVAGMAILAGASVLCAIGALVQRSLRTKALDEDAHRRTQLDAAREELERACQSLLHHQERASRRRFDISVDSVRLGLAPMPTDLQLKEREAEVESQRRQRAEWDKAHATLSETLAMLSAKEDLRRQKAQALMAAQGHERQTVQQWNQWKVHAGLTDSGSSQRNGADGVRTESELLETCRRLRVQIAEWEQSATEWNTRARAALAGVTQTEGSLALSPAPVAVAVAPPATDHSPALQAARRRLQICEDTVTQLFSQAGVSDENAFRARLAASRRRLDLSQTIRSCEMRCNDRLRREASAEAIQRELSEGNVEDWRRRSARSASEISSLEASRDEIMRRLRQLDADIAAATAESADLAGLEVERAGLAAEALAMVRASRTLAVAGSLLEDARRHVERECQPPALRRASEALSAITFSRYERLGLSEDEREIVVLDARNGWTPVSQLSRGTVEQLHFSVRIGLAEESAQRGPRLPIIIDDVLDHFDPKRSQAMARQVVELSRRHQIFVFTRRPETSDLLQRLDPTANLITLQEL